METLLTSVKDHMTNLKEEITDDDERFEDRIKEAKVQEMISQNRHGNQLVMFNK